mgnify:FL=1
MAVIEALKCLKYPCEVTLYTDSQYVQKGITEWIYNWKKKKWHTVKNVDLWQILDSLNIYHKVTWCWIRGHDGNEGNEYVDKLANLAIKNYQLSRLKQTIDIES